MGLSRASIEGTYVRKHMRDNVLMMPHFLPLGQFRGFSGSWSFSQYTENSSLDDGFWSLASGPDSGSGASGFLSWDSIKPAVLSPWV